MKSDVVIGEVLLKLTNEVCCVCLVVKETTCDLVKEGVGEGVGLKGGNMRGALSPDQQQKSIQSCFLYRCERLYHVTPRDAHLYIT